MTTSFARRLVIKQALLAVAATSSMVAFSASAADKVLRVSAIPDEAPTELQRKFKPLGEYLSKETGMKVVFTPVSDYAAVVESLATGKLDMAWLGGFTYVQAKIRTKGTANPIVQRAEDAVFTSRFVTADPNIKTLEDLKGKTFAFGAPSSTSGSLMPRYFILKAGINPEKDFKNVAYSGAHDATVAFVAGIVMVFPWHDVAPLRLAGQLVVAATVALSLIAMVNYAVMGVKEVLRVKKTTPIDENGRN